MGGDVASTPGIEPVTRARMRGLIFTVLVFALSRLACYLCMRASASKITTRVG